MNMTEEEVTDQLVACLTREDIQYLLQHHVRFLNSPFGFAIDVMAVKDNYKVAYECKGDRSLSSQSTIMFKYKTGIGQAILYSFYVNESYIIFPKSWLEYIPLDILSKVKEETGIGTCVCDGDVEVIKEAKVHDPWGFIDINNKKVRRTRKKKIIDKPPKWYDRIKLRL